MALISALRIAILGSLACSVIACSREKTEDRAPVQLPEEGPIDLETLENLFPQVVCEKTIECECAREDLSRSYCEQSVSEYLTHLLYPASEGVSFDGDVAWECLNSVRATGCDDAAWTRICSRVIVPQLEVGDACRVDAQCVGHFEGNAYCAGVDEGTCQLGPPRAGEGEPCAATLKLDGSKEEVHEPDGEALCAVSDALYCEQDATCARTKQEGEDCDSSYECASGNYCSRDLSCEVPGKLGDECEAHAGMECGQGNYCSDEEVCAEQKPLGAECTPWAEYECADARCSLLGECVPTDQFGVCEHFNRIEIGIPDPGDGG